VSQDARLAQQRCALGPRRASRLPRLCKLKPPPLARGSVRARGQHVAVMATDKLFHSLGFSPFREVTGRASVADLFPVDKRCGIYALSFADGEFYVGKSLNVARRFVDHTRTHQDIAAIAFKPVRQNLLDKEEQHCATRAETAGIVLRNIQLMSVVHGETDLDDVVRPDAQATWERSGQQPSLAATRPSDAALRRRYARKFEQLQKIPFGVEAIEFLRRYLAVGLLSPASTELTFWSVSALPNHRPGKRDWVCLSRVSVGWQEVCTVGTLSGHFLVSLHLCRSVFEKSAGSRRMSIDEAFPTLEVTDHRYEPGGQDQLNLEVEGYDAAMALLNDPAIQRAVRSFNLRLMRKGATPYGRYHCFDLADRMFEPETATTKATGTAMPSASVLALLREWPKGEPVPAISIKQPWAGAVVWLGKDVENRSRWLSKHRGPVLIHASSAKLFQEDVDDMLTRARKDGIAEEVLKDFTTDEFADEIYPTGAIVGVASLADVIAGSDNVDDDHPAARSPWTNEKAAYWLHLTDAEPCIPLPFKGQVGLFRVPYEIAATLKPVPRTGAPENSENEPGAGSTKSRPKVPKRWSAARLYMRPMQPSPALAAIVGNDPLARTELTTKLWEYITEHDLQDTRNKRLINCDNKLRAVTGKDQVDMFELTKFVSEHLEVPGGEATGEG